MEGQETGDIQNGENAELRIESNKKKVKTPSQLEALKEIYRVNKYPSEELKQQLAEQLGLTDKQVTNWFCNRRVRDKRVPSKDETHIDGRQDRSSGVIVQDHGSYYGPDSSGSTKQVNRRPPMDSRDVESRCIYRHDSPSADLTYELRSNHHHENIDRVDDTSSESSSASQERYRSRSMDKYDVTSSRFTVSRGTGINPIKDMGINYKPSGYLKVRGEIENAAVTTLKRQLGKYYREDGPPLGVEFQPLPPGAFESAGRQSAFESYYDDHPAFSHSPNINRLHHPTSQKAKREFHDSKANLRGTYEEALNSNPTDMFDDYDDQPYHRSKQTYTFTNRTDHLTRSNSSMNIKEDIIGDDCADEDGRNLASYTCTAEAMKPDHSWNSGAREPQFHDKSFSGKWLQNPLFRACEATKAGGGGPSGRLSKVKTHEKGGAGKEHFSPIRERGDPSKDMTAAKKLKNQFPKPEYHATGTLADLHPCNGYPAEMRSRLSDDEAAATCSSSD